MLHPAVPNIGLLSSHVVSGSIDISYSSSLLLPGLSLASSSKRGLKRKISGPFHKVQKKSFSSSSKPIHFPSDSDCKITDLRTPEPPTCMPLFVDLSESPYELKPQSKQLKRNISPTQNAKIKPESDLNSPP